MRRKKGKKRASSTSLQQGALIALCSVQPLIIAESLPLVRGRKAMGREGEGEKRPGARPQRFNCPLLLRRFKGALGGTTPKANKLGGGGGRESNDNSPSRPAGSAVCLFPQSSPRSFLVHSRPFGSTSHAGGIKGQLCPASSSGRAAERLAAISRRPHAGLNPSVCFKRERRLGLAWGRGRAGEKERKKDPSSSRHVQAKSVEQS